MPACEAVRVSRRRSDPSSPARNGARRRPPDEPTARIGKPGRLPFDSGTALREAAVAGLGIARVPLFLVGADLAAARLVAPLGDRAGEELLIHVLYPHRRHLAARMGLFVDRLAAESMSPAA